MNEPAENPTLTLVLASGSAHKAAELADLAASAGLPLVIRSAREFGGMPEVEEDTGTFVGNARKKAVALLPRVPAEYWVLADDSGICVDHLDGGPGVESAYFAGADRDDAANLRKLVEVMRDVPEAERGAHYTCVLVLRQANGCEQVFEGECRGRLASETAGKGGFGYDPFFIPDGETVTFGLLPLETKQMLSHRAQAWRKLADWVRRGEWRDGR